MGKLLYSMTDGPSSRRLVHWHALALITLISFLFGANPVIGGALQRLLWVLAGVSRDGRDAEKF